MPRKQPRPETINKYIMQTMKKNQPETIEQLVKLVQLKYLMPQEKIVEHILYLQHQGKLTLKETPSLFLAILKNHLLSTKALWYWITITLALATTTTVFTIPENIYPIVYARYVLGSIFVLFLPGYSLIKALFPTRELDNIERAVLSIVMSLALVPITALLLNYTPWGIRTTPVTLSLLTLTTIFATAAIIQELMRATMEKKTANLPNHVSLT